MDNTTSVDFSSIISPSVLKKYIEFWINEDIPSFDLSTIVINDESINANIEMKEAGVIAGLPFAEAVIRYCDCRVDWKIREGERVDKTGAVIGVITGPARRVVMAERTALNVLSRACGVATVARRLAERAGPKWRGELAGNRKTTPGFRAVEKYAMLVGGVSTHRYDLSSGLVMVKDNHVRRSAGIDRSVRLLRAKVGRLTRIEVECGDAGEALEAAKAGADVVMLDNFSPNDVRTVSKQVKNINPTVLIEASGGINENNIMDYATENVDVISSSLFSQGYKCIDISINAVSVEPTITDHSESPNITNHQPVEETISADKSETDSSSVVPKTNETIEREKFAVKRKHEETSVVAADKPNTIINKVAESPTLDKINSANKPMNKQHPNKMSMNRYESPANKQRKSNPNGKGGQTIYNLQSVGSVRMPGQPVRFDGKGPNNNRNNMDNQANLIRTMAANLVLQLQNNQNNHPPFMNPNTMRFGGPIPRVPFMNNVKFFCKACNIQNPNAFCQMCRKKLE